MSLPWGCPGKGVQDGFCTGPAASARERPWPRLTLLKPVLATQQARQGRAWRGLVHPQPCAHSLGAAGLTTSLWDLDPCFGLR